MMWLLQWEFQIIVLILREPCKYCLLGFCSMMNVFRIMNFVSAGICHIFVQFLELSKPNKCQGTNYQKPPWAQVENIYGINLFNLFNSYTKDIIIYILSVFWSMYQCEYGPEDYWKDSTHIWFIKWRCLMSFLPNIYTHGLMCTISQSIIRPIH